MDTDEGGEISTFGLCPSFGSGGHQNTGHGYAPAHANRMHMYPYPCALMILYECACVYPCCPCPCPCPCTAHNAESYSMPHACGKGESGGGAGGEGGMEGSGGGGDHGKFFVCFSIWWMQGWSVPAFGRRHACDRAGCQNEFLSLGDRGQH